MLKYKSDSTFQIVGPGRQNIPIERISNGERTLFGEHDFCEYRSRNFIQLIFRNLQRMLKTERSRLGLKTLVYVVYCVKSFVI